MIIGGYILRYNARKRRSLRFTDFEKLWVGETISYMGAQISIIGLPLAAISLLQVSSFELGLLNAFSFLPFLLLSLFAGVIVDRTSKRRVLIFANLGRAFFLLGIPVMYWLNELSIGIMCICAFLIGTCTVLFDAAFHPYIPKLIHQNRLVEANAKLIASSSVATTAGPGIGGFLIKLLGPMLALVVNSFSYLFSVIMLVAIKTVEQPTENRKSHSIPKAIKNGLMFTLRNPTLRAIMGEAATYNFFSQAFTTLLFVYVQQQLKLSEITLGIFFSFGGVGALIGSILAKKAIAKIGIGPATVWSMIVGCSSLLLVPLASGTTNTRIVIILTGFLINGIGLGLSNVNCITLRQTIIPENMRATAMSASRLLTWGGIPLGALLGGIMGEVLGIRETLLLATMGMLLAPLWVILSPLRNTHELPAEAIPDLTSK